jgi:hypothetical protein
LEEDFVDSVAAVGSAEAEDEDEEGADDDDATLDLVGVLPESTDPASLSDGDNDDDDDDDDRDALIVPPSPFLALPLRSSLDVAYQTATAVATAARPITTNVVVRWLWLSIPMSLVLI